MPTAPPTIMKIVIIFLIVGGAMLIPAGQTLFARLFGQADDMRAGGGWLRSAFYGGRVAGAMTFGLAAKGISGIAHAAKKRKSDSSDSSEGSGGSAGADEGDHYTDSGSESAASDDTSSEAATTSETEGGSSSSSAAESSGASASAEGGESS